MRIRGAGRFILTVIDGKEVPVTIEAYRDLLAAKIAEEAPDLTAFRAIWVDPDRRKHLLASLPESGKSADKLRLVEGMTDYDLYDVLGSAAYGLDPRTKPGRADAFLFKARIDVPEGGTFNKFWMITAKKDGDTWKVSNYTEYD